ncbi:MAG: hypothetical protein AB1611_18775 [bacterium]
MTIYEQVIGLTRQLSPLDKLRLIENLTRDIEASLQTQTTQQRRSLRGLLKGCSISAEEIDHTRKEMWGNFPREDFNAQRSN